MFFPRRHQVDIIENTSNELIARYESFLIFVRSRFSRHEKFGLILSFGMSVTIFFLFIFFGILQDYIGHDALIRADTRIINLIYLLRSSTLNNIMLFFTNLGTWQIVFIGVFVVSFLLFALNLLPYLFALIISVIGGEVSIGVIKYLVQRPRPPSISALVLEKGFSFPSGHSLVAFSFYGFLSYIIYRISHKKTWKILSISAGMFIIAMIGFSRVYLGIHWPSDVLASFALGAAWLSALITMLEIYVQSSSTKENVTLIGKKFIIIPSILLILSWFLYIGYFFKARVLIPQSILIQNILPISEKDIPNGLFANLPRTSESITGSPIEPINIIIVGNYTELTHAFRSAGWIKPEPITLKSTWHNAIASIFNKPYPNAIETPAFWNSKPNDFAFQLPTTTIRQRHHIHFWSTPFVTDYNHRIWFATAHFDKAIKLKTIIPTHTIDPNVDNERDIIRDDLLKTGSVDAVDEFQLTRPGTGKNPSGDKFITDGKAFVLFLKDGL